MIPAQFHKLVLHRLKDGVERVDRRLVGCVRVAELDSFSSGHRVCC